MKASEALREAAAIVSKSRHDLGGCIALSMVCRQSGQFSDLASTSLNKRAMNFFDLFNPIGCKAYWFDNKNHRILSLLMAAEIAESEGD